MKGAGDGLPLAARLEPGLNAPRLPRRGQVMDRRVALLSALAMAVGLVAGVVAEGLIRLIALVTNLAYRHQLSTAAGGPGSRPLAWSMALVPVAGGILVGFMARYGSKAIRGHGIPEAMEQVLVNDSRIPARVTLLKPISSAIAIGTGGPFGAEGPIIATGGALGSLLGQFIPTSAQERKTLLAAGAAAGMAATFGAPVAAVLLAVELLLFELRPRSVIPVALACVAATSVHYSLHGIAPVFRMGALAAVTGPALAGYILVGAALGLASVAVTRAVYAVEDAFERLPVHWMWWPALGGLAVGVIGHFAPRTLGVGYDNLELMLNGRFALAALAVLGLAKFLSWTIALGSGTSGGTLAPLFTMGGALGALLTAALQARFPALGLDPRMGALVGMAAIFAGAARSLLASAVFAFEITLQPISLLPLLGGCAAAYMVSAGLMRQSIMTEKLARRGVRVPIEFQADHLDRHLVKDHATRPVVTLAAAQTVAEARHWLRSQAPGTGHQGYPVLDRDQRPLGVVMGRELLDPAHPPERTLAELIRRPLAAVMETDSLREAADHMLREGVGRLPVLSAEYRLAGILTRSDLLAGHRENPQRRA
jgi:H+/Cl- antiporter ClcA/CBS domain-containing protein